MDEQQKKTAETPFSARLKSEDKDFLQALKDEKGGWDAALAALRASYDAEKIAAEAGDRRQEIYGFLSLLNEMKTQYIYSVNRHTRAKDEARDEFKRQLETSAKNEEILHSEIDNLRAEIDETKASAEKAANEYNAQCAALLEAQNQQLIASEKATQAQSIIDALTLANKQLQSEIESARASKAEAENLRKESAELLLQLRQLQNDADEKQKQHELSLKSAILQEREKASELMNELRSEAETRIAEAVKAEAARGASLIDELKAQLAELRQRGADERHDATRRAENMQKEIESLKRELEKAYK